VSDLHDAIVVTWPKSRSLDSYVAELNRADREGLVINFRVANFPKVPYGARCYHVHDGYVRGWVTTLGFGERELGEVIDPVLGDWWPAGKYIVRHPTWYPLPEIQPMKGFQGWRYYDDDDYWVSSECALQYHLECGDDGVCACDCHD
jgi:hypothetical protein